MSDQTADRSKLLLPKILVVEDDAAYRRIVYLQLRAVGCECLTASNHAEALRLLHEDPEIGVILLDYTTMNGSGPGVLVDQLAQLPQRPRIIGQSSMDRARDFAACGIREFLIKPLDVGRFIGLLTENSYSRVVTAP